MEQITPLTSQRPVPAAAAGAAVAAAGAAAAAGGAAAGAAGAAGAAAGAAGAAAAAGAGAAGGEIRHCCESYVFLFKMNDIHHEMWRNYWIVRFYLFFFLLHHLCP